MGFRMNIHCNNRDYGDDHKLYGYQNLKDLSSFQVLIPDIIRQWSVPNTYSDEDIYYMYFCVSGATDDLILDEIEFSVFAKRYCNDVRKAFGADGDYIINYMEELINLPGKKVLSWC